MSLLNVVSNAELTRQENAASAGAQAITDAPTLVGLASHITKCWTAARTEKQHVLNRILDSRRARRGEYDPGKLAAIKAEGGSEEYGRVTGNKCRVAESWLRDVYLGQAEKAWTLKHTPKPLIPDEDAVRIRKTLEQEIMEAVAVFGEAPTQGMLAARRNELEDAVRMRVKEESGLSVERMEELMADQLLQADFNQSWSEFLNDFVTYPAAHFKGPVLRRRTELAWVQAGGKWTASPKSVIVPSFERIDPARAFPAPGTTSPQDGYFIEHITLERSELYDLIGVDGFDGDQIRAVLAEAEGNGLRNWMGFTDAAQVSQEAGTNEYLSPDQGIDCLEFSGPLRGKDLLLWGLEKSEIDDPEKDYESTAWLIGGHVIKAMLNPNPVGVRPVFKACWEEIPGEYWGRSLPDALADVQGVVNAAIRALVNNMGIGSGPQVTINVDRLAPGEQIGALVPWQIRQVHDSPYGSNSPAIEFFQPDTRSTELIAVMEKFYQFADDWSLIPRYMQGSDQLGSGIGRTASGLSMLFNAANKGLKGVVSIIDHKVLSPVLSALYTFNMLYSDDDTIKGDAQVEARGAVSLMQIETLQLRRNEFLQATANPIDSQIVGVEGRAEVLREVAKGLEMDVNRVVPMRGSVPPMVPGAPNGQMSMSKPNQEQLFTGGAVTDNFSPNSMRSTT